MKKEFVCPFCGHKFTIEDDVYLVNYCPECGEEIKEDKENEKPNS